MTTTHAIKLTMGPREWAMLITLSVIWGGSFFFNRLAVAGLPVFTIVAIRVSLAACILWLVVLATRTPLPARGRVYAEIILLGLFNNALPFTLIVTGQTRIGSGIASILNATTPFFTVIVANIWLHDERLTLQKLIGVITGIAGVTAMIGVNALSEAHLNLLAELCLIGASISYAVGSSYARRFRQLPPLLLATGMTTTAAFFMVPLSLIHDRPWELAAPPTSSVIAVLMLASLCTAFAYLLFFRILKSAGATNVQLVTFLVPVSAILLGILFLGESLELRHVFGMLTIGAGLALMDGRLIRRLRKQGA